MKHCVSFILGLVLACWAAPSAAQEDDEVSCDAPLQGDELRYPHARVVERTWKDLAAVPASVVGWEGGDWARFALFTAPSVALMVPAEPSLDVRFQRWLQKREKPGLDRFFVKIKTIPESVALAAYGAILFSAAYVKKDDRLFEYGTLALEALAVQQFFHVTTKLLMGRESPYQGEGQGEIYGPTKFLFPGGTPSGHASTAYAQLAVLAHYWDRAPLYALMHLGGLYVSAALVYERQHFLSDVIIGSAMGYYIGRWVVRHRSSRYRCRAKSHVAWYQRVLWLPLLSQLNGFGLAASYRY